MAPGGTGKSIYAMTMALCLAASRDLLNLKVWEQCNVAIFNEDPMDELDRRLAAIMMRHQVRHEFVQNRYFMNSMDDRGVLMAAKGEDGFTVVHPDEEALVEQITANHIGLCVVDPFAESHTLEENSNPDMIKAAAAWRRVARRTGCAILLVHHVRKGAGEGNIDSARGAKGLTDSARVGLIMSAMTEDEAGKLNVPIEDRFQYVRVDDGKVNLSPRIDKAKWFKMDSVQLGNATENYPHGDRLAALVPWEAPSIWEQTTPTSINAALDRIGAGLNPQTPYGLSKAGGSNRWAGTVLMDDLQASEQQAKGMLKAWIETGLLVETEYLDAIQRKPRKGVSVIDSKRPTT